jgi:hypothetical protein
MQSRDLVIAPLTNWLLTRILMERISEMNQKTDLGVRWFTRAVTLLVALCIPSLTFAQNCPLCYTQAAGAGSRMIQALRSGILILVVPPMLICVLLTVMAYRKRDQFNEE